MSSADAGKRGSPLIEAGLVADEDGGPGPDFVSKPQPETLCGDGRVTGVESCDFAIKAGRPGACPTACPDVEKCVPRVLNGTGCQARCELRQLLCQSGDGCCPGNCTQANDSDCSATCGDGVLQPPETCEENTDTPCKKNDAECDDGDPCTQDKLMGSAAACNVRCAHIPITELHAGDGCCPKGANANTDTDCKPSCGNHVRESGEVCDGAEGCSADCKLMLQPDQLKCLESAGDDACKRCACMNCVSSELACWDTPDMTANMKCANVQTCARSTHCHLDACYCGANVDLATCLVSATGPCKKEIEAAAGTTDPLVVNSAKGDTTTPLGRAYTADSCRVMQCQDSCR